MQHYYDKSLVEGLKVAITSVDSSTPGTLAPAEAVVYATSAK